jgi:hypothetical protein
VTNFSVFLGICGLNPDSGAVFLDARRRHVVQWMRGDLEPPASAFAALSDLHQQQQKIADAIMESWDDGGQPAALSITVAADDETARETGWPSVGAQIVAPMIAQSYIWPARIELAQEVKPNVEIVNDDDDIKRESASAGDQENIAAE